MSTVAELQDQLEKLTQQCASFEQACEEQKTKVQNMSKRKKVLQNMVSSLQETKNKLMHDNQSATREESERKSKINDQNRFEEEQAIAQIKRTKESFVVLEDNCNLIEARKKILTEKFNSLNYQLDVQIADYQIKIDQTRAKTREIRMRSDELDRLFKISHKRNLIQESTKSKNKVKTTIESVITEIERMKQEIEKDGEELQALKQECQQLQKTRDLLRKKKHEQQ